MGKTKTYDDLIGVKYNDWTVVAVSQQRNIYIDKRTNKKLYRVMVFVRCECNFERYVVLGDLRSGKTKRCRKCHAKKISGNHLPHLRGNQNGRWCGVGEIPASMIGRMVSNAKARGHTITITPDEINNIWIKQKGLCALSGLQLIMPMAKNTHLSSEEKIRLASLDRIDSNQGYTSDNVQWVCKTINLMKRDLDENTFFRLIKTLYEKKHES